MKNIITNFKIKNIILNRIQIITMIWKNCKDLSFNQYNHFNLGSLIEDIGVL